MTYEMTKRKPEPTFLPTQGIFKPPTPYRHGMRGDAVSHTQWGNRIASQLNVITMTEIHTPVPGVTYPTL